MIPTTADLVFVILVCSFCFTALSTRLLNDAGIGWHIRTGQHILATHAIPRVDLYSSIVAGKPWIAWEWLYDVIAGVLESSLGLNGVVWFTAVVIGAAFAWTFQLMMARGTNLFAAVALILLALSASMIHILARPHVVSWLFTVMWFSLLDSSEREAFAGKVGTQSRWLWVLPISMVVWANVHGGFLLGFVLCAIFWIGAFWTWRTIRESSFDDSLRKIAFGKRLRNLSWVIVLSFAASLVNPYGFRLYAHIFSYLTNTFFMEHIDEFQSPNFHFLSQKCFLVLVILMLAMVAIRKRKLNVSEGLLAIFAMYAGLYATRNIPVSSILLVLIVGPLLPNVDLSHFAQRMAAVDSRLRGHAWCIVAILFVFLVDWNGGRMAGSVLANAHFDPNRMPVAAVNYLEKSGISQPVLSPDYWGGYLIYRLYPKMQVVIDDRHDLYGERVMQGYLKMLYPQPGWDDFLREHGVRRVLMPKNAELTAMLKETPGWSTVYSDNLSVIFVRSDSTPTAGPLPKA